MPDPHAAAPARGSSFGRAAEEYDRHRPAPPPSALRWMLDGDERTVLDLAAGTGQISRQLPDVAAVEVVAVEPDPAMRAVLARRCPHARVLDGTAERIPLEQDSVDAVLVGSAWHWFDHDRADPEVARVLRPGGRLAAVGTSPDASVPWVAEIFGGHADEHLSHTRRHYTDVTLPGCFEPIEVDDVAFLRPLTIADALAYVATGSHYLAAPADERARLDRLGRETLAGRFPGADTIDFPTRTRSWRTRLVAGS